MKSLMTTETDGTLSFGDYTLASKTKMSDYAYQGDMMKVKTFKEITRLEKNGMFLYESVPGTEVSHMEIKPFEVRFTVSGFQDTQITVGLEEDAEYHVMLNQTDIGTMKTIMGGKLSFSIELEEGKPAEVIIRR